MIYKFIILLFVCEFAALPIFAQTSISGFAIVTKVEANNLEAKRLKVIRDTKIKDSIYDLAFPDYKVNYNLNNIEKTIDSLNYLISRKIKTLYNYNNKVRLEIHAKKYESALKTIEGGIEFYKLLNEGKVKDNLPVEKDQYLDSKYLNLLYTCKKIYYILKQVNDLELCNAKIVQLENKIFPNNLALDFAVGLMKSDIYFLKNDFANGLAISESIIDMMDLPKYKKTVLDAIKDVYRAEAYNNMAKFSIAINEFKDANKYVDKALKYKTFNYAKHTEGNYFKSIAYFKREKYKDCIEYATLCINQLSTIGLLKAYCDFAFGSVYLIRGQAYLQLGNKAEACADFKLALEDGDKNAEALLAANCK